MIARRTSIDLMPEVTALVLPGNKPSIEIFKRLGFDARGIARGQFLYVRPAGPAPESLSSDVYLPPSRV